MEKKKDEITEITEKEEVIETVKETEAKPVKTVSGMAITSRILGIVGVLFLPIICGTLAIIFSVISKKNNGKNGMATAGLILGIIDVSWKVVAIIIALIVFGTFSMAFI